MYENRVRVYNEGVLVAVQSEDGTKMELLDNIPDRLVPLELFGPPYNRTKSVSFWNYFLPYFLMERLIPANRKDLQDILKENNAASRESLGHSWNYRMWDDDIHVEMPE